MRRRVYEAFPQRKDIDPDELTVQTYHAFAASLLREHALGNFRDLLIEVATPSR